jgi:hypothetical protein
MPRCPNGTRKNKKTNECVKKLKTFSPKKTKQKMIEIKESPDTQATKENMQQSLMTLRIKNATIEFLDSLKKGPQLKKEVFYSFSVEYGEDSINLMDSFEEKCNKKEIIFKSSLKTKDIDALFSVAHIAYFDDFHTLPQLIIEGKDKLLNLEKKISNLMFNKFTPRSWSTFYRCYSCMTNYYYNVTPNLEKNVSDNVEIITLDGIYNKIVNGDEPYILK